MKIMKKRILLVGASGRIASGFIKEYLVNKEYNKKYDLVLGYHSKNSEFKDFKFRKINIEDLNSCRRAIKGIDVVLHLAANPNPEAEFKDLLNPNIIGTYNIFEAARLEGVKRVIFASSIHAVQGYGHGYEVGSRDAPRPIDLYGATKAFGEALCHTYFSKYGISCLAIRIGAYTSDEQVRNVCFARHDYDHIISERDMNQLIHKCIVAPSKIKYGVLSGISNNKKKDMDLKCAKKLVGYMPKDDSYKLCKMIKVGG